MQKTIMNAKLLKKSATYNWGISFLGYILLIQLFLISGFKANSQILLTDFPCYSVAEDNGAPNFFFQYDPVTDQWTNVGVTGTGFIEAIATDPVNDIIYAANGGTLGTIEPTTGLFTAIGPVGTGNGITIGSVLFDDIDGLSYDPNNEILWASQRIGGLGQGTNDLLLKIDPATGAFIPGEFINGDDYAVVQEIFDSTFDDDVYDVDDIAYNPYTDVLYAIQNQDGPGLISELNKFDGTVEQVIIDFPDDDVEGLGITYLSELYATTGDNGTSGSQNTFIFIDILNSTTTTLNAIDPTGSAVDFESFDCLTGVNDLAIRKVIASTQPQPIEDGDTVTYEITLYNQGDITNTDILLSDYIPMGLTLVDPNWTGTGQIANLTIPGPVAPGDVVQLTLQLSVNPGINGTLTNYVEISESFNEQIVDPATNQIIPLPDVDSTPDNLNDEANGLIVDDQINGAGPNANQDEDDHDIASFAIGDCIAAGAEYFPCYTVAEDNAEPNTLYLYDQSINTWTKIGVTGTSFIEAIAADPINNILYAVDGGTLGRLNTLNGMFTPIGNVGAGNGESGSVAMDDIDGLTYDPVNNILFGSHRIPGTGPGSNDLLIQIDPLTGALIPGAFEDSNGNPVDYAIIEEAFDGTLGKVVYDVDDIALNPYTSELFAIQNEDGPGLISILDKLNGSLDAVVFDTPDDDLEGLGFNGYGELFATSGDNGMTGSQNSFISIDYLNSSSQVLSPIDPSGEDVDFESFDCFAGFNDLALQVTLAAGETGSYCPGDMVTFDVTVHNQGLLTNESVLITNYFPNELTLSDATWVDEGNGTATTSIPCPFSPGQVEIIPITFQISNVDCAGAISIDNYTEISQSFNSFFSDQDGNLIPLSDIDSQPDFINNEINVTDNEINQAGGATEDEDDHDIETIQLVSVEPVVGSISVDNATICFNGTDAQFSVSADGAILNGCSDNANPEDFIIPDGYNLAYVLTSGTGLVIEQIQTVPNFTVQNSGDYTVHTLVYNPNTLNVGSIIPGTTTGFDVNSLLLQGGGEICAALDVTGVPVSVINANPGTITLDTASPVCFEFTSAKIRFTPNGDAVVPAGFELIYIFTFGANQTVAGISTASEFSAINVGTYAVHTLVYDPVSFNITDIIVDVTNASEIQTLIGNATCGAFDQSGTQIIVERPDAAALLVDPSVICASNQSIDISAITIDPSIVPSNYQELYFLVNAADFTILDSSTTPDFTISSGGQYSIHTFVYDPVTFDATTVNNGVSTIFDINYQLIQGGGSICAALDTSGALFNISSPSAGSVTINTASPVCIQGSSVIIEGTSNADANIPPDFQEFFIFASGANNVIQNVSASIGFTAVSPGTYSIHSFVFNPLDYNLSNINVGTTSVSDIEALLFEAGGSICGSLNEAGTSIEVVDPQIINLQPLSPACLIGGMANVEADIVGNNSPFSGYTVSYVLTSSSIILDINQTSPQFNVNAIGDYTIHSLVYDPSTLDLSTVNFGTTSAADVNSLLVQGGGNICAVLDLAGATVNVGGLIDVGFEDGSPTQANCGDLGAALINVTGGASPYSFVWSDGFSQEDRMDLNPGSYSVLVSDAIGCEGSLEFTITGSQPIGLVITETCEQSAAGGDAVLDFSVSGGNLPYTITVTDQNGNAIPPDQNGALPEWSTLSEGQYTIDVEDADNCSTSQSFIICPYTCLLEAEVVSTTNVSCNGDSNGSITISSSTNPGAEPINYTWLSGDGTVLMGQDTEIATGLSAGAYEVLLEDINGCTLEVTAQITEPSSLSFINCNAEDVTTTGGSDGIATVVVEGGTSPYSYVWSDGQTINPAINLGEGSYDVTITDTNGCETSGICDVQSPSCSGFDATANVLPVTCNGEADGSIEISVVGSSGTVTYNWSPATSTSALATGLDVGVYEINVSDAVGCEETLTAEILEPAALSAVIGKADVTCFGAENGSLDLQLSGGTEPYIYSWSNGITTEDQTGLGPASYSITVTDANNCTILISDEISEPTILEESVEATLSFVSCPGDTDGGIDIVISGGSPPYSYNWSNGSTSEDLENITAGEYTVTVTDNNGCKLESSYIIGEISSCSFDVGLSLDLSTGQSQVVSESSPVDFTITLENQGLVDAGEVELIVYIPNGLILNDSDWILSTNPGLSGYSVATTINSMLTAGSTDMIDVSLLVDNGATPGDLVLLAEVASATETNGTLAEDIDSTPDMDPFNDAGGALDTPSDDTRSGDGSGTPGDTLASGDEDDHDPEEVTISAPIEVSIIKEDAICGENGSASIEVIGGTAPYTYQWSDGFALGDRSDLPSGNYSVSVTDSNGFTGVGELTILAPPPVDLVITETCERTTGGSDAVLDYSVSGGAPPYSIEVTDGSGVMVSPDVAGALPEWNSLNEGQYDITISDSDDCVTTQSFVICPYTCLLDGELVSLTNVTCNGGSDGEITISATTNPGADPISYVWLRGDGTELTDQTTATASGLLSGAYEVQLEDANGCTLELTFEISEPAPLVFIDCNAEDVTTTGGNDGTATAVVEGGTSPYSYVWSDGQTVNPAINLDEGSYNVTITDGNGCETSGICDVQSPSCSGFDATANVLPVTCNGAADGSIEISVVGSSGTVTYNWSPAASTGALATGLDVGVYEINVSDGIGCEETLTAEILEPAALSAVIGKADVTCFGAENGSLDLQLSGGTEPYSYSWNNSVDTEDQTGLGPGTYTVTVTDANNCTIVISDEISEPTLLEESIEATLSFVSCPGDTDGGIDISISGGSPPYSYNWSNGSTSEDLSNMATGSYMVTVTDNNGCELVLSYTIGEISSCSFDVSLSLDLAIGQSQIVSESSPVDFTILLENQGLVDAGEIELIAYIPNGLTLNDSDWILNTNPGLSGYTVATTLNSMLTAGSTDMIDISLLVDSGATPGDLVLLAEVASATETDGTPAEDIDSTSDTDPFNDAGGALDTPSDDTRTGDGSGTPGDTITATDEDDHDPEEVTITVPIEVNILKEDAICGENGSAKIEVIGGTAPYTYQWSDGFALGDRSDLSAGNYSVSVTDSNGFTGVGELTILAPPPVDLVITETCERTTGGSDAVLDYSITGGAPPYSIEVTDGSGTMVSPDVAGVLPEWNSLSEGQYDITITDADGCVSSSSFVICPYTCLLDGELVSLTNVTCNGGTDGEITISATTNPGADPISYVWLRGDGTELTDQTTATATGLLSGAYEVQLEDANGCTLELTFEISEPAPLVFIDCNAEDVTTTGGNDGTATVVIEGGTSPYSYVWSDGQIVNPAVNLGEGSYDVTITDSNGCETSGICDVQSPTCSGFDATANVMPVTCNGAADGSIEISVVGSSGTVTYNWSPASSSGALATGLDVGVYEINVSDQVGCEETLIVEILEPAALTAVIGKADVTCFGAENGSLDLQLSGGTEPYSYSWSNGITTEDQTGLGPDTYTVTVTGANDCIIVVSDEISEPTLLEESAEANLSFVSCPGDTNGAIDISVSGGSPPYSYNWSNGLTSEDLENISAGEYTVTVTDNNGCELESSYTIGEISSCSFDVGLSLDLSTGQSQVVSESSPVDFTITLENQGLVDADEIELIAYIPNGLILNDSDWILNTNPGLSGYTVATTLNSMLTAGSTDMIDISLLVDSGATPGDLVLLAEVASATETGGTPAEDIDSTPDMDPFNDAGGVIGTPSDDTRVGDGSGSPGDTDAATDEDDHDPEKINISAPIEVSIVKQDAICGENGSATIEVIGGTAPYTYQWSDGFALGDRNDLPAGNYSVSVTDSNGFAGVGELSILAPPPVDLVIAETCERTTNGSDAVLDYSISGGVSPYNIDVTDASGAMVSPDNPGEFPEWNSLSEGQYDITITDSDGCITTQSFVICPYTCLLDGELISLTDVTCNGGSNGEITISATTNLGADPISYFWLRGDGSELSNQTSATATGLLSGVYEVQLEDANGCTLELTFEISEPAPLVFIDCNAEDVTTTGGSDGTATVVVEGGTSPYSYIWTDGQTVNPAIDLGEGSYEVTITDGNGCEASGICDVQSPSCSGFDATANVLPVTCSGVADGSIEISVVGPTGTVAYSWSDNVADGALATNLEANTYEIKVKDAAGCQENLTATVLEPTELTGVIAKSDVTCFGAENGSLDLQLSGGTEPYSFTWNNGSDQEDQTGLGPADYSVTIVDENDCVLIVDDEIVEPSLLELADNSRVATELTCLEDGIGAIDLSLLGGSPPYSFNWSNGETTEDVENLEAGSYTVTITDNNGCEIGSAYTINNATSCASDLALIVEQASGENEVEVGDDITLTITVSNQGIDDLSDIELITYLPEGLTLNDSFWTLDGSDAATITLVGTLLAGEETMLDITLTVAEDAIPGDLLTYVEVLGAINSLGEPYEDVDSTPDMILNNDSGAEPNTDTDNALDGNGENDEDDHDVVSILLRSFDLALQTTLSEGAPSSVAPGQDLTLLVVVTNQGSIDAYDVTINQMIPEGLILNDPAWNQDGDIISTTFSDPVFSGSTATVQLQFIVDESAESGALEVVSEIVSANTSDGTPATDIDSTFDTDLTNDAGGAVGTPSDNVIIGDGSGDPGDGNALTDEDDHDPVLIVIDDINIDLELYIEVEPQVVSVGDVATWTITVTNQGPDNATGVTVLNETDTGIDFMSDDSNGAYNPDNGIWDIGDLEEGETTALVLQTVISDTMALNTTAQVQTANEPDADSTPGNNVEEEDDQNSIAPVALGISGDLCNCSDGLDVDDNGINDYAYQRIIITSVGAGELWNLTSSTGIVNAFGNPFGVTALTDIGNGTYVLDAYILADGETSYSATFEEADLGAEVSISGNPCDVCIPDELIDLEVLVDVSPDEVFSGDLVTWTITLINNGPDDASGVSLSNAFETGLIYISDNSNGAFDPIAGIWDVGNIENGEEIILLIETEISNTEEMTLTAQVETATQIDVDSKPGNSNPDEDDQDSDTPGISIPEMIDLEVLVEVSPNEVFSGNVATWRITLINNGPDDASGVSLLNELETDLTYISDNSNGTFDPSTGIWNVGDIASGEEIILLIETEISNTNNMSLTAQVETAMQADIDSTPGNNNPNEDDQDSDTPSPGVPMPDMIDLEVLVDVSPDEVFSGDVATWTITLINNGPDAASGVSLLNELGTDLTYISDNSNGAFDPSTGIWNVGDIANGEEIILLIETEISNTNNMSLTAQVETATQADVDSTPGNNNPNEDDQDSDTPGVPMPDMIDLEVLVDVSPDEVFSGDVATWTITLINNGPDAASGVSLLNELGTDLTYISDNSNGAFDPSTGIWNVGDIASGEEIILLIETEISNTNNMSLTAQVETADQIDIDSKPGNNNPNEDDQDTNMPGIASLANNPPSLGPDQTYCTEPVTEIGICVDLSDPDGDNVAITDVTTTFNCSIDIFSEACFTYIPLPGLTGTDTIRVIGCDDGNPILCDEAIILVEIKPDCNDRTDICSPGTPNPIIEDCTPPVTTLEICVPDFCALDDETEQIQGATTTFNCSIDLEGDNCLSYTPLPGFEGVDTVTIVGIDFTGMTDTVYAYIEISEDCSSIKIDDITVTVTPGETTTISVIDSIINNSNCTNDELVISITGEPTMGMATLNEDGTIDYTADEDATGSDIITYMVCCEDDCSTGIIFIEIGDEPLIKVEDTTVTVPPGGTVNIPITDLITNNSECTDDELVISIIGEPTMGIATLNEDGSIDFTANEDATGSDSITYQVCCEDECSTGTIYIEIEIPDIVANDDDIVVAPGGTVNIPVLDNDENNSDCTDDELTITLVTTPTLGEATINEDGTIEYIANEDATGADMFVYELCCNDECDIATINIIIGQAPIAVDDMDTTTVGEPITISVLDNDSDPDGDDLVIVDVTEPNNGSAVIFEDNIVYVPDSGFVGIDTFMYVICDMTMPPLCDTATVIIVVEEDGNEPPEIVDEYGNPVDTLYNSTSINEPLSDCLSVIDPDGDPITIEIIENGSNGTAVVDNDTCFTYTPDMDFVGTDTLLIVACDDGIPPVCDTVVYIIEVDDNLPPIAENDTVTTMVNTPIDIAVLDNDEEPDGDPLSLEIIEDPLNGTATINQDGSIEYVPNEDFIGEDSLQYVICDNAMPPLCDTAWVFISIIELPLLQANDDFQDTEVDEPITFNICDNDIFEGEIDFPFIGSPSEGDIEIDGCNITYTPDTVGEYCFIYVIQDEFEQTDTAEICINVIGPPDPGKCQENGLENEEAFPKILALNNNGDLLPWEVQGIDLCCDNPIIYIFNRWGNMVYKNENYQPGDVWRGEHHENAGGNNQLVPDGTYFYCVVCPNEAGSGEDNKYTGFIHVETD